MSAVPVCPWCSHPILPIEQTEERGGRAYHMTCAYQRDDAYEAAARDAAEGRAS